MARTKQSPRRQRCSPILYRDSPPSAEVMQQQARKLEQGLKQQEKERNQALYEIRKYQLNPDLVIEKQVFQKLVQEICSNFSIRYENQRYPLRMQSVALLALQESAEANLVNFFDEAYFLARLEKRNYIIPKDIQLTKRIRGEI
jgi:histone H3